MKNKVKSLKAKNLEPVVIKLIDNISNYEACENEKYLIKVIGRRDLGLGTLVNLTNGGEGVVGYILNEEDRKKISNSKIGIPRSEETKKKISAILTGRKQSEEFKIKLSKATKGKYCGEKSPLFGKKQSLSTCLKKSILRMKTILQYDLEGNFIKEWNCALEASKEINKDSSGIRLSCRKEKRTC